MKNMNNKKNLLKVVCLLIVTTGLLVLANLPATQAQTGNAILFEGARLIVGDGSAPIENSAFMVENSRFTKIGRKGAIQPPAGALRVDLTGKTVMPAMIDTHEHLGMTREDYIDQLNRVAFAGIAVTTSMGRDSEAAYPVRAEQPPNGAQFLTCGRGLVGPLGIKPETVAAGANGRLPEDLADPAYPVATEEQARIDVRELALKRVDCVKIWVDDRLGTEVPMKPEVYRAIIDEAHKHNLRVFAHMWYLDDAKNLARAGVDSFAHPIRDKEVDDELVQLLKDRPNIIMQTNLSSTEFLSLTEEPAWLQDPLLQDLASPAEIKKLSAQIHDKTTRIHEGWPANISRVEFGRRTYGIMVRNTAKLYKAGVPYAVGTDAGGPTRGFSYHVELELLVKDVGLTPSQVITMATRDSARALHLDDLGTVAPGKIAAFLVLDANPLDDITNTRRISKVYLRGHEINRATVKAAIQASWNAHRASE